jgi:hypothetical protein
LEARAARFSLFSQLHYCGFSAAAAFIDFRVERAEAGSRSVRLVQPSSTSHHQQFGAFFNILSL